MAPVPSGAGSTEASPQKPSPKVFPLQSALGNPERLNIPRPPGDYTKRTCRPGGIHSSSETAALLKLMTKRTWLAKEAVLRSGGRRRLGCTRLPREWRAWGPEAECRLEPRLPLTRVQQGAKYVSM